MIDTGAALTAVSEEFALKIPDGKKEWKGPTVSLANGQLIQPRFGVKININIGNKEAKGLAIVMPLPNTDI